MSFLTNTLILRKRRKDTEYGKGGPSAEGTSGVRVDRNDINDGEDEFVDHGPELSDSADEGEGVTGNNDRLVGGDEDDFYGNVEGYIEVPREPESADEEEGYIGLNVENENYDGESDDEDYVGESDDEDTDEDVDVDDSDEDLVDVPLEPRGGLEQNRADSK